MATMSQRSQRTLLDVALHLGDARETMKSTRNFHSIVNKDVVDSVEITAGRNFQRISAKFLQEGGEMEGLLEAVADFKNLQKFSMKLLPKHSPGHCPLSAKWLALVFAKTTKISSIALVNVTMSENIDGLLEALGSHPSLQCIRLVNCDMTQLFSAEGEPPMRLFQALSGNPNLKTIRLANVEFQEDVSLVQPLADLISSRSSRLESLTLKKCDSITTEAIHAIMEALKTNRTLRCLVLDPDETGLFYGCIFSLGVVIRDNGTIEEISVRIPSRANLMPIAQALKTNRSLKNLHFLGNLPFYPTQEASDALYQALFENFVFQHIGAPGARGWTQSIDFCLRLNRAGRQRFVMEENKCTRIDWVNLLIEHRDDLNVVYYFLSKKPEVCMDMGASLDQSPNPNKRQKLEH